MSFAVEGVRRLEQQAIAQDSEGLLEWLRQGFQRLRAAASLLEIRHAFSPLVILPEDDPVAQVGMALREAEAAQMRCAGELRRAILSFFGGSDVIIPENVELLRDLWWLLNGFPLPAPAIATAKKFVGSLRDAPTLDDYVRRSLASAAAHAVAAARPVTNLHLSFFEDLKSEATNGRQGLWDPAFVRLVIGLSLGRPGSGASLITEDQTPYLLWQEIIAVYPDDLAEALDPERPSGRALRETVARAIAAGSSPAALEKARKGVDEVQALLAGTKSVVHSAAGPIRAAGKDQPFLHIPKAAEVAPALLQYLEGAL